MAPDCKKQTPGGLENLLQDIDCPEIGGIRGHISEVDRLAVESFLEALAQVAVSVASRQQNTGGDV